jgi:hypothetical protein
MECSGVVMSAEPKVPNDRVRKTTYEKDEIRLSRPQQWVKASPNPLGVADRFRYRL